LHIEICKCDFFFFFYHSGFGKIEHKGLSVLCIKTWYLGAMLNI